MLKLHVVQLLVNKHDLAMVVFPHPAQLPSFQGLQSCVQRPCQEQGHSGNNVEIVKQLTKWNQI